MLLVNADDAFAGRRREMSKLRKTIRGLSSIDTNYIEPQHYNYTIMLQSTYNYDLYQIRSNNGHEMTFYDHEVGAVFRLEMVLSRLYV